MIEISEQDRARMRRELLEPLSGKTRYQSSEIPHLTMLLFDHTKDLYWGQSAFHPNPDREVEIVVHDSRRDDASDGGYRRIYRRKAEMEHSIIDEGVKQLNDYADTNR